MDLERGISSKSLPKAAGLREPEHALPSVHAFDDFRKFLQDWFQAKKAANPLYSGALFAKRAGISSHTLLGMVIRGERNLSPQTILAFSRALGLSPKEALYFEKLVLFNQASKPEDKDFYLEQLLSFGKGSGALRLARIRSHALYLSEWYNVVIRELVNIEDFSPDSGWIVKKLKKKITRKQAESAWALLLELGLVAFDEKEKRWKVSDPAIDIEPGAADYAIRNFHRQFLKRADDSLSEDIDQREFSSLTLTLDEEELSELRERVRAFRKEVNLEFSARKNRAKGQSAQKVVTLNAQLLILTE